MLTSWPSSASTSTSGLALRGFVDTNGAAVESSDEGQRGHLVVREVFTNSTLFIAEMAESAADSSAKRTNPKPRLRPVSRSFTTICLGQPVRAECRRMEVALTASSTVPNSSNFSRKVLSSVCHARPLCRSRVSLKTHLTAGAVCIPNKKFRHSKSSHSR